MFAVDVCLLPATGSSTFVVVAGLFLLIAGVVVTRWVRSSVSRISVVVAPLVLLGGLVLAPSANDPCVSPTTTPTVPSTTTTTTAPTTTVAATTTTTVAPVVYTVGQPGPGGGIVFYDAGSIQSWGRYLEVACAGWQNNCDGTSADPQVVWGCNGYSLTGADGTAIGTGQQNTADIVAECSTADIAADLAVDYSNNTLDDWFLPSRDEFNELCKWAFGDTVNEVCNSGDSSGGFLLTYGGFSIGDYWSSSEGGDGAWIKSFNSGIQYDYYKLFPYYVRPVRAFGVAPTTTVPSTTTSTTTTVPSTTTTIPATTTTTTTTIALTCATGGTCVVGNTGPGGGIVFYDAGSMQSWGRYLEAAPVGVEVQRTWATGGNQSLSVSGADGTAIGTGEKNTEDIVLQSGNAEASSAAVYCSELDSGGQSDWFLPSKDELNLMYTNLHNVNPRLGGFSSVYYWSSSEFAAGLAWEQGFDDGNPGHPTFNKRYGNYVRPVRAF